VEYFVGITLLQGGESLLADRAISQVIAKFKGATVSTLEASELELGGITDALAPSLFGDSRVIVIKEIQDLPAEIGEEITSYLEAQDESVELVLWHKGGVKGKALLEKIKKAKPTVIACDVIKKDGEKSDFIRSEFKRLGRTISTEAVQALIDALGSDLRELGGACSQLAADVTAGKMIDETDVMKFQNGRIETTGFDVEIQSEVVQAKAPAASGLDADELTQRPIQPSAVRQLRDCDHGAAQNCAGRRDGSR
jgi:DNA polymerase-3 subunit delta